MLWYVLPVWPCLSAITPLSGNIKIYCHGKVPWLRLVPTYSKDPGVGWICHINMFNPSSEKENRCQNGNYYSDLNKNSGCNDAMTAALAYYSLVCLCIQGCASLEASQIRSTWEAH